MRDELTQELEAFEAEIAQAGRMKIDGGTDFSHSDAAIALALAYWLSDHHTIGACIGETPLKGYWSRPAKEPQCRGVSRLRATDA